MSQLEQVSGLLLDEANPRFVERADSQESALTALLLDGSSKLLNLAKDIVGQGILNPTELPIVIDGEEDGELIVIEGNRRIAALKLLRNPSLAKHASDKLGYDYVRAFSEVARGGTGPDSIEVVKVESREAARHWIELRHTGENDGIGVLEWNSWQANNYRRRKGSQVDRASLFCNAVEEAYPKNTELLKLVSALRKSRLTTLGRLISDPSVRNELGIEFDEDQIFFHFSPEQMLGIVTRIFSDLAGKKPAVSVTDIKTKELRAEYIRERASELPDRSLRLHSRQRPGENFSASTGSPKETGQFEKPAPGSQPSLSPGAVSNVTGAGGARGYLPEPVIFKGLRLPHFSAPIQQLLREAQKVNIDDLPRISGILVRIIVELVVTEAIDKKLVIGNESSKLREKIKAALKTIDANIENPTRRDKSLEMVWMRTQDQSSGFAIQSLNAFIHNPAGNPTSNEVRELSRTFRVLLERLNSLAGSVVP